MIKRDFLIYVRFCFVFCILSLQSFSQSLNTPFLNFTGSICATEGVFNEFKVEISFKGSPFSDPNNIFYIEISDKNGSFDNASKVKILKTLKGNEKPDNINGERNLTYTFTEKVKLVKGIFGDNYVLRIRTTSPVLKSLSTPFGAYYLPKVSLELNNYEDVFLCGSDKRSISLKFDNKNIDPNNYKFQWKKNGVPFLVGGPTIKVNKKGNYRASIYVNGGCTVPESNEINVSFLTNNSLKLEGNNKIKICGNQTHTFKASIKNKNFEYIWYKDDKKISNLNKYQPTYTTADKNQMGKYRLEINTGGSCALKSQTITLTSKGAKDIQVSIEGEKTHVLLPGETTELKLLHNLSNIEVKWFLNNNYIKSINKDVINISKEGVYYAQITDKSSGCKIIKKTEKIKVVKVNSLKFKIDTNSEYKECISNKIKLSISNTKGLSLDKSEYNLSTKQLSKIKYQWYKNKALISGETNNELTVDDYSKNGLYTIKGSLGSINSTSNEINVILAPDFNVKSSSKSNKICIGGSITLSAKPINGYVLKWFKDDENLNVKDVTKLIINKVGKYKLSYKGNGCSGNIEFDIKPFDNSSTVIIKPSRKVVLDLGKAVNIKAEGADSYEWFSDSGQLISINDSLETSSIGVYTLIAKVGQCKIQKSVEVYKDDGSFIIPNIITPFEKDGINDTWKLPNKYSYNPDVYVYIYNSKGDVLLSTNNYENNWPNLGNIDDGMVFYFKIIKKGTLIKAGTISVLK